ncbi:hypothetical protein [Nocardioides sp. SYSU DS0663]
MNRYADSASRRRPRVLRDVLFLADLEPAAHGTVTGVGKGR